MRNHDGLFAFGFLVIAALVVGTGIVIDRQDSERQKVLERHCKQHCVQHRPKRRPRPAILHCKTRKGRVILKTCVRKR